MPVSLSVSNHPPEFLQAEINEAIATEKMPNLINVEFMSHFYV